MQMFSDAGRRAVLSWTGLLVAVALGCGSDRATAPQLPTATGDGTALAMADTALVTAVAEALAEEQLTASTAQGLTALTATGRGITSLEGIGALSGLTLLDVSGNRIEDVSPLSALTRLEYLDLRGNAVEDITPLAALKGLSILGVAGNQITDITALGQLPALETLDLTGNPLAAPSPATIESLRSRGVAVLLDSTADVLPEPVLTYDFSLVYTGRSTNNLTDLYRVPADGSAPPENVSSSPSRYGDLAVSLDFSRIAFIADAQFRDYWHLWVMEATSTGMTKVNQEATGAGRMVQLAWSPDNTRIVLRRRFHYSDRPPHSDIWLGDPAAGTLVSLTGSSPDNMEHESPAWSADGTWIAFLRGPSGAGQVIVQDVASGVERKVQMPPPWDAGSGNNVLTSLAWAPGSEIIVGISTPAGASVWRLDPFGGPAHQLLDRQGWSLQPALSPVGSRIALFSNHEGPMRLYTVRPDGSDMERVTIDLNVDPFTAPRWVPDGSALIIREFAGPDANDWWLVAADGSAREWISNRLDRYWYGPVVPVVR